MPAVKKNFDFDSSKRKHNPLRRFSTGPIKISFESLNTKVSNMKETAEALQERLCQCERTMANVEVGMEQLQNRVRQLQQ